MRVSAQPLIAVSGVRSSCDTDEMNSFFIASADESSSAIWFIEVHSSPISSSLLLSIRTEKSPIANLLVIPLIWRIGRTIEPAKYRPVTTMMRIMTDTTTVTSRIYPRMVLSISVSDVTILTALYSLLKEDIGADTASIFSPPASLPV